ncbi:MAG TPA: hypothetical protein VK493_13415, partial [Bryobacteraceae bacterium]|nr:hypothetical protein [Bryobacteraceae bacterium]
RRGEEWQSATQWHECVPFGKAAGFLYLTGIQKGAQVFAEAEPQPRKYERTIVSVRATAGLT